MTTDNGPHDAGVASRADTFKMQHEIDRLRARVAELEGDKAAMLGTITGIRNYVDGRLSLLARDITEMIDGMRLPSAAAEAARKAVSQ